VWYGQVGLKIELPSQRHSVNVNERQTGEQKKKEKRCRAERKRLEGA